MPDGGAPSLPVTDLEVNVHVGLRLRMRRRQLRLTQQAVAAHLGVVHQVVAKYENAECAMTAYRLARAARALSVEIGWFFEGLNDG